MYELRLPYRKIYDPREALRILKGRGIGGSILIKVEDDMTSHNFSMRVYDCAFKRRMKIRINRTATGVFRVTYRGRSKRMKKKDSGG